jgi:carboxymethylenebutenolidase
MLVVRPAGTGPFPVVVLFSPGLGLSPELQLCGHRVASAGFAVAMIDRYSRMACLLSYDPAEILADPQEAKQYLAVMRGVTDAEERSDLAAAIDRLQDAPWARPAPWGALGFGVGVRPMIRAMAADPGRFVAGVGLFPMCCVIEGPDSPHLLLDGIEGSLYFGLAGADSMVTSDENAVLAAAIAPLGDRARHEVFPRARHRFPIPGACYDQAAADRCFQEALELYTRTLVW